MTEPTTGMATGSDAGAPGDHLPPEPLDRDEQALLADLRSDAGRVPPAPTEVVQAVEDDAPLPVDALTGPAGDAGAAAGADGDDPDSPVFSAR
jgi:hypothetical protein